MAIAALRAETVEIRPQPGPQEEFLSSKADIVIFGGQAGGGKSYGLLLEPLRHVHIPGFAAVIFRRTTPEIRKPGGLWDASMEIYPLTGATSREQVMDWNWPSGASVSFDHMENEKDKVRWGGSSIALIGFDELPLFTEGQFWFIQSRNRSTCGVRPYLRATCNPVPDDDPVGGWLCRLIAWWIGEDGFPIPERSGVLRWFIRVDNTLEWGDSAEELKEKFPAYTPQSLTFIPSKLEDNPALERKDPSYRTKLMSLPLVERERLLGGNWKIKPAAGKILNRAWFEIVDAVPADGEEIRYWDKAGTEGGGDWTAGVRMKRSGGIYYVTDVKQAQLALTLREKFIKQIAELDGQNIKVWVEQEPGSGGKDSAAITVQNLAGFNVHADRVTGDKVSRCGPFGAQAEAGNVKLLRGPWNAAYLDELHAFDGHDGGRDNQVDASSGAFNKLALPGPFTGSMSTISWIGV